MMLSDEDSESEAEVIEASAVPSASHCQWQAVPVELDSMDSKSARKRLFSRANQRHERFASWDKATRTQVWNAAVLALATYEAEPAMYITANSQRLAGHTIESIALAADVGDGLVFLLARDSAGHLYLAVRGSCKWADWTGTNLRAAAAVDLQDRSGKVHSGFMRKAKLVPVEELLMDMQRQRHRVILCGHSLGGAVASLAATRLLSMVAEQRHDVLCITFGAPSFADAGFSEQVRRRGEEQAFLHFVTRQDIVPVALRLGSELLTMLARPTAQALVRVLSVLTDVNAKSVSSSLTALLLDSSEPHVDPATAAASGTGRADSELEPLTRSPAEPTSAESALQWLGKRVAAAVLPEYVPFGRVVIINPKAEDATLEQPTAAEHMIGTWASEITFPECIQEHAMDFYLAELATAFRLPLAHSIADTKSPPALASSRLDMYQPVIDTALSRCGRDQTSTSGNVVLRFALEGLRLGYLLPLTPRHLGLSEAWRVCTIHRSSGLIVCEAEASAGVEPPASGHLLVALASRIGSVEAFRMEVEATWYLERKERLRDGSFSIVAADLLTLITTKQHVLDAAKAAGCTAGVDTETLRERVIIALDRLHDMFCDRALLPPDYLRAIVAIGAADARNLLPSDVWHKFAQGLQDVGAVRKLLADVSKSASLTESELHMSLPKLGELVVTAQRDFSLRFEAFRVLRLYDLALLALIQAGPLSDYVRDNNWWWWVRAGGKAAIVGGSLLVLGAVAAAYTGVAVASSAASAGAAAAGAEVTVAAGSVTAQLFAATAVAGSAVVTAAGATTAAAGGLGLAFASRRMLDQAEKAVVATFDTNAEGQPMHYLARSERVLSWLEGSDAEVCLRWQAHTLPSSPFYSLSDHYKLHTARFLRRLLLPIVNLRAAAVGAVMFSVMAVGQPGVGKTSLLSALFGTDRKERTEMLLTSHVAQKVLVMDFPGVGDNAKFRASLLEEQQLYVRGCDAALVLFKFNELAFDVNSVLQMVRSEERPLLVCLTYADQVFSNRLRECKEELVREGTCDEEDACLPAMAVERALDQVRAMRTTFCERYSLRRDQVMILAPRSMEYNDYPEALRSSGLVQVWEDVHRWLVPIAAANGVADFADCVEIARREAREARRRRGAVRRATGGAP